MNELLLQNITSLYQRKTQFLNVTIELIDTYHLMKIAIEAPFFWKETTILSQVGKGPRACNGRRLSRKIPFTEYLPKKIKMANLRAT